MRLSFQGSHLSWGSCEGRPAWSLSLRKESFQHKHPNVKWVHTVDSEIIIHRHLLQMESWMLLAAVGKELAGLWAMHTWWGTYIHPGLQAIRAVLWSETPGLVNWSTQPSPDRPAPDFFFFQV